MAVDPDGNPAFITTDDRIVRKKAGKWEFLQGCSTGVTIGSDGTLYRRDCDFFVNKYVDGEWKQISDRKCSRMAVGSDGTVWIRDYHDDSIIQLEENNVISEEKNSFKKFALTTGPNN